MIRRFLIAATLGLALAVSSAAHDASAQQATAMSAAQTTDAVNKVQAFYDKAQTFSSDFVQEYTIKAYNQKKSSKGHVVFAKPGKMDFTYTEPKDNRVVSDGQKLRAYEAANKQMYESAVDKSQHPAALSFLTGTGKLADAFVFQLFDGAAMAFPGGQVLVGAPKQANPAYEKVLFYVDAQTSQVRRVLIIDGQGNRNRFDFVNPQVNTPVTATQFTFTPPPGTTIIKP